METTRSHGYPDQNDIVITFGCMLLDGSAKGKNPLRQLGRKLFGRKDYSKRPDGSRPRTMEGLVSSLASQNLDSTSVTCELSDTGSSELPAIPSEKLAGNSVNHLAELPGKIQSGTAEDSRNQIEEMISSRGS